MIPVYILCQETTFYNDVIDLYKYLDVLNTNMKKNMHSKARKMTFNFEHQNDFKHKISKLWCWLLYNCSCHGVIHYHISMILKAFRIIYKELCITVLFKIKNI